MTTTDTTGPVAGGSGAGPTAGLVRVTLLTDHRRLDLALPGALPVAELVPEVARTAGVLDVSTVHAGYELVTADGRRLAGDAGLTIQGVEDGTVLTVAVLAEAEPVRVYDDVVEAMADAVERDSRPWSPAAGRRTALVTGVLLLSLGAFALALQRPDAMAAGAAAIAALVLVAASVVLERVQREHEVALTLGWLGVGYAAVSGLTGSAQELLGLPVALAGTAAAVAGTVVLLGLERWRAALIPAVAVGGVFAVSGTIVGVTTLDAAAVHAVALVVAVMVATLLPWASLGVTGTQVEQAHTHADLTAEPTPIDDEAVRRDAALGHQVLLAVICAVGLLGVLVAPMAVHLGLAGTLVAVCVAAVLMLRTRTYRIGHEVAAGLVGGVAVLVAAAVAVLVLHPTWHAWLAMVLALVAALLLLAAVHPPSASVRRGRAADVAEVVALVAMLPLLAVATGLVAAVRG